MQTNERKYWGRTGGEKGIEWEKERKKRRR